MHLSRGVLGTPSQNPAKHFSFRVKQTIPISRPNFRPGSLAPSLDSLKMERGILQTSRVHPAASSPDLIFVNVVRQSERPDRNGILIEPIAMRAARFLPGS